LIRGIIFDLGSTLLQFTGDQAAVERAGAEAMADWYLKKKHIKLDGPALVEAFLAERAAGRMTALETQMEVVAQQSLGEALKKIDAPAAAGALVEGAIKVYFTPEEAAWVTYPDASETLKQLKSRGYRLGLYSNATDDKLIQRLVNQGGLRPWLSPTFSSAGWGWRKPRPEPFELIAGRWGLASAEVVVVGDTLSADVLGAQNAGMPSILVTMNESPFNGQHRHIQPTVVAETLSALPEIVAHL
jgi:phosphoglycolate phosphatase-like HAD superfamily hydrolase